MLQLSIITSGSFLCRHNINKQINLFYDGGHTSVCGVDVEGLTMRSYSEIHMMDHKNGRKINMNYCTSKLLTI